MSSKRKSENNLAVPTRQAWGNLDDLDVHYAFDLFGGKSLDEALPCFTRGETSRMERASELRFVTWEVFSYYITWFTDFLMSSAGQGESDCASCFLNLILYRAETEPAKLKALYPKIKPTVDTLAERQSFYDASVDIYGSFSEQKQKIEDALAAV